MKYAALLLLAGSILICSSATAAPYTFQYTANISQAYKAYLALRPDEGDALVRRELFTNPDNLLATYVADYGDFLTLLFNGDPYQREQRKDHQQDRVNLLSKGSDGDPWKRLSLAGVHLHWALVHLRFGEQLKAALAFRKSYLLLKENAARFPKFMPNAVLYGTEEAIAGTIPDQYNWLMNIFGMKGNLSTGMTRLSVYLKANTSVDAPLHEEALIYDIYTRFYLGSMRDAIWQIVSSDTLFDTRNSLLRAFVRANIALSYRRADAAMSTLKTPTAMAGASVYPVFDYEMGCALLMRLDPSAITYLERFTTRNKGKLFTKDALQKIAMSWYLSGNMQKAQAAKALILTSGSLNSDADKQAQRFARSGSWPNALLLRSRLLIDGGYSAQALPLLKGVNTADLQSMGITDKLEYDFRLGRAYEETNELYNAVQAYQRVINAGRYRQEHFAARSALQMALIYERGRQLPEARKYFELCLSMKDHDFQASIDQQAKAGLSRVAPE